MTEREQHAGAGQGESPCAAPGAPVASVAPDGIAAQLGLEPGDRLAAIDGRPVTDILDYQYRSAPERLRLGVVRRDGDCWDLEVEKDEGEPLGLTLEGEIYDAVRRCDNRCLFCFVDQLPAGLREPLYLKDDDFRLSVLHGNFITLTNLGPADLARLEEQRLSPLYVSIHATDTPLRRRMLGNPAAPPVLDQLGWLTGLGLKVHGQIVLSAGHNDGAALDATLGDLLSLSPPLASLAVVPVGLTRCGDARLKPFDAQSAAPVLDQLAPWQERFRRAGAGGLYAADEWYLLAGRPLPGPGHYGDFPQLENGVGLVTSFARRFRLAARRLPPAVTPPRRVLLLSGKLFAPVLNGLVERLRAVRGLEVRVAPCANELFGPTVTAAGLLGGRDLVRQAGESGEYADLVAVPGQAFRFGGDVTLDGYTLDRLAAEVGRPVVAPASPGELLRAMLGPRQGEGGDGR